MVQNQSRIPKCFYESILSGLEWNFSVTARNVVFDSWYIRSFEVSNRTSMAWIWIGSQNEAFYCTELSSFKLIADLAFCRSKVAAIGSTWSKVDDVLVEAVDERYSLANISSTFHRPPQSSREPYLKNELFDKTKLKNARFIKFIFLFSISGELTLFLNNVLIIQSLKLNYVKLHYVIFSTVSAS